MMKKSEQCSGLLLALAGLQTVENLKDPNNKMEKKELMRTLIMHVLGREHWKA